MLSADVRLRGPWLIGQPHLNTSDLSQSGTLLGFNIFVLPLNGYTFVPSVEVEVPGTVAHKVTMPAFPPLTPDRDAVQYAVLNSGAGALLYAAEWRQIDP